MNHTHKRRSKTPPLSVLFNTIIAQNTIIAIIYFKLASPYTNLISKN
ncbi:hypothetical protein LEQ41_02285 [Streptococcus agalactiae]|nr:hypothetical protein [Streptococcus agalactiae]